MRSSFISEPSGLPNEGIPGSEPTINTNLSFGKKRGIPDRHFGGLLWTRKGIRSQTLLVAYLSKGSPEAAPRIKNQIDPNPLHSLLVWIRRACVVARDPLHDS